MEEIVEFNEVTKEAYCKLIQRKPTPALTLRGIFLSKSSCNKGQAKDKKYDKYSYEIQHYLKSKLEKSKSK